MKRQLLLALSLSTKNVIVFCYILHPGEICLRIRFQVSNNALHRSLTSVFAYGVGTWHRHKIADGSKISIVLHSRRMSHTELNYAQMATEAFCTISFRRYLHICVFIVCIHKASTGLLPEVELLLLIIKQWGALCNADGHIKLKNSIEGKEPVNLTAQDPRLS